MGKWRQQLKFLIQFDVPIIISAVIFSRVLIYLFIDVGAVQTRACQCTHYSTSVEVRGQVWASESCFPSYWDGVVLLLLLLLCYILQASWPISFRPNFLISTLDFSIEVLRLQMWVLHLAIYMGFRVGPWVFRLTWQAEPSPSSLTKN